MNERGSVECRRYREGLIELARRRSGVARRAEVEAHIERCPACRATFYAQRRLSNALMDAAAEAASVTPPAKQEALILAEFDRVRVMPGRKIRYGWAATGVLAASLVAGVAVWQSTHEKMAPEKPPRPAAIVATLRHVASAPAAPASAREQRRRFRKPSARPASSGAGAAGPFIPIPYTAPLAPEERADVVQVDLPVSALIAAGLPLPISDPGARARADVMVSEDGRARAVRLISISDPGLYRSIR